MTELSCPICNRQSGHDINCELDGATTDIYIEVIRRYKNTLQKIIDADIKAQKIMEPITTELLNALEEGFVLLNKFNEEDRAFKDELSKKYHREGLSIEQADIKATQFILSLKKKRST